MDTLSNIMTLYRESNKIKVRGVDKITASIRFLPAVMILLQLLKYSAAVGGGRGRVVENGNTHKST